MVPKTNLVIFVAIVAVMLLGCNGTITRTTQTTTLFRDGITTEEYSNGQFTSSSEASKIRIRRRSECPWWVP
ncbi:unnamed protein product, partial [Didymodactylos carnosus]